MEPRDLGQEVVHGRSHLRGVRLRHWTSAVGMRNSQRQWRSTSRNVRRVARLSHSTHTLGVLTFATAESGRRYTKADLAFAMDLANRAAVAIDNTRLYQALREADHRKDEFLATLAHELRNPLAPVRNALEMLKRVDGDATLAEGARSMMGRQVTHMSRLIDDLMDVSRITRGKLILRREKTDLSVVIHHAVDACRSTYADRRHDVRVTLPPEPLYVDGDSIRLEQVIGNLSTTPASTPTLAESSRFAPPANAMIWW